jgi:hydroxymethylpyrimidine/phosphomethylpyrimidine kinase
MTAIALSIAGSDPSGGAGIQADLKSFAALGVYGAALPVALTAQNTRGVFAVQGVAPDFVATALDALFDDLAIGAVKIGMVPDAVVVEAVRDALVRHGARNIVVDPVIVASSGDRLLPPDAVGALRDGLFPLAAVVTPNLLEAAALLGEPPAAGEAEMMEQARRLLAFGSQAVLLKGGHAGGPEAVDVLVSQEGVQRFAGQRVETRNTHGTGCTLSAAIAAELAKGQGLFEAIAAAKAYVGAAIAAADRLQVGGGHGPLHHFHAWWD